MLNKQQQYWADNVDADGNVFPTVGENIRNGVKNTIFPFKEYTNIRLVEIGINNKGVVTISENINIYKSVNEQNKSVNISFPGELSVGLLLVKTDDISLVGPCYALRTFSSGILPRIGFGNCPFSSRAIIIVADTK